MRNVIGLCVLLAIAMPVYGQARIQSGARVAIQPMGGFETYFAAAVQKKHVPVTITLDKTSAQYFLVSSASNWQGWIFGAAASGDTAAAAGSSTRGTEAAILLVDGKTKDVVWSYEVHKSSHGSLLFGTFSMRGQQSEAEACAKHLKDFIEKGN